MSKQSEKSRHIGGKPDTRDEAENRRNAEKSTRGRDKGQSVEPKNADVGDLKNDR